VLSGRAVQIPSTGSSCSVLESKYDLRSVSDRATCAGDRPEHRLGSYCPKMPMSARTGRELESPLDKEYAKNAPKTDRFVSLWRVLRYRKGILALNPKFGFTQFWDDYFLGTPLPNESCLERLKVQHTEPNSTKNIAADKCNIFSKI